jgi:hypothetical protein
VKWTFKLVACFSHINSGYFKIITQLLETSTILEHFCHRKRRRFLAQAADEAKLLGAR